MIGDIALAGLAIIDTIKRHTPTLEDEVTVEVVGQPGATKQQLYFLALSAACGVARQIAPMNPLVAFFQPSAGMLMIEYDAADNWVRCILKYQSGMAANYASTIGAAPGNTLFDRLVVMRGPSCNVNGASFGFTSLSIPAAAAAGAAAGAGLGAALGPAGLLVGIVVGGLAGAALGSVVVAGLPNAGSPLNPSLPFSGQPILTACPSITTLPTPSAILPNQPPPAPIPLVGAAGAPTPSPNPKPPGDNRSRGAIPVTAAGPVPPGACCAESLALIPLVFSALSFQGTIGSQTFPDPTAFVGGVPGG